MLIVTTDCCGYVSDGPPIQRQKDRSGFYFLYKNIKRRFSEFTQRKEYYDDDRQKKELWAHASAPLGALYILDSVLPLKEVTAHEKTPVDTSYELPND